MGGSDAVARCFRDPLCVRPTDKSAKLQGKSSIADALSVHRGGEMIRLQAGRLRPLFPIMGD
jgi:hypothetical protein